jgi:branched-chain amino acid transport system permease protein
LEAASVTAAPPRRRSDAVREFISTYGLIAILLILPVVYGIQDLSNDGNLTRLGENLVEGLSNGAILALIALGYTLVYGIIELINFAHGEVFMLGSLTAAALYTTFGLTPDTATGGLILGLLAILVLSMLVSGTINVMIERVAYRPLRNAPKLAPLITAVGMSFILQNVGILWIGASQKSIPDLIG